MAFDDKLLPVFVTHSLAELYLREAGKFYGCAVIGRQLCLSVRTPVGTAADGIESLVGSLCRSVKFILSLGLNEQHLGIAQISGIGGLSGGIAIGCIVQRVDVLAEKGHLEDEVLTGIRIVEALGP